MLIQYLRLKLEICRPLQNCVKFGLNLCSQILVSGWRVSSVLLTFLRSLSEEISANLNFQGVRVLMSLQFFRETIVLFSGPTLHVQSTGVSQVRRAIVFLTLTKTK